MAEDGQETTQPPSDIRFGGPTDARIAIQPVSGTETRRPVVIVGGQLSPGGSSMTGDPAIDIPLGLWPNMNSFNQYGSAQAFTAGTIWPPGTPWEAEVTPQTITLASGVGDGSGSTGAFTVEIFGISAWNGVRQVETITLDAGGNGTSVNQYVGINFMVVRTHGSAGPNVNDIAATGTKVLSYIRSGEGAADGCHASFPAGYYGLITGMFISTLGTPTGQAVEALAALQYNLMPDTHADTFGERYIIPVLQEGTTSYYHPFNPYMRVNGPASIRLRGALSQSAEISAGFDVIILDTN